MGAEGQRKIPVEKGNKTENWTAVRSVWDGSKKTDGRTRCGVVVNGLDRDKLITISKNCRIFEGMFSHGSRSGGSQCSDRILDLGLGKPSVWTT